MSLYSQWQGIAEAQRSPQDNQAFWNEYFEIETEGYKKILERKENFYEDSLTAIAEDFGMSPVVFAGFMDGINTSLVEEVELEKLKEDSAVSLKVDFDKLYYNMLEAKAKWLYTLSGWDDILSEERRREITNQWRQDKQAVSSKVGRNEPCPCGSGKKYKKCCGAGA